MTQAGLLLSWNMKPGEWIELADLVDRCGVPALVEFARATAQTSRQPIRYPACFLRGGWRGLPPATMAPPPAARPAEKPPYCGHIDCDEITRMRDTTDPEGRPLVTRCPECHPDTRKDAA